MELRHLRYFIAVAEELHFSNAAKRLNISQPPLSHQISQLEELLGAKLFYRTNRRVELTEAGSEFLKDVYHIFDLIDMASKQVKSIEEGARGELILGFTGSWSNKLLRFLRYYRTEFPNVNVQLHQSSTSEQVISLQKQKIDIAILAPPIDNEAIHLHTIHEVPFCIALPSTHRFAKDLDSPIDLNLLRNDPFIMSPRNVGPAYYDSIISMCNKAGFSPNIIQEAEGIFTILTLISAEIGVSLVSELALEHPKEGVVFRRLKDESIKMNLSFAWKKDNNSPIVAKFIESYKKYIKLNY